MLRELSKQVGQSSGKRGPLTCTGGAEEYWSRCDTRFTSSDEWTLC